MYATRVILILFAVVLASCSRTATIEPPDDSVPATPSATASSPRLGSIESSDESLALTRPAQLDRHALLIGVNRYPYLQQMSEFVVELQGPSNDVELLSSLIINHWGFPRDQVVTMTDLAEDTNLRPTYDNVAREFEQLIEHVQPGDQVLIFLAGHGTQQPVEDPDDPTNPEPDGLDEVFLLADSKVSDDGARFDNALVDVQLRQWVEQLAERDALVCLIADCCHAGTITRGREVLRHVDPWQFLDHDELAASRTRARDRFSPLSAPTRGPAQPRSQSLGDLHSLKNVVALYAVQPDQKTPEKPLPPASPAAAPRGLFTWTLVQILEQARRESAPLTYRQWIDRVRSEYRQQGYRQMPELEGELIDHLVFSDEQRPAMEMVLAQRAADFWQLNAGSVHGLTEGTVLQVIPPAGTVADEDLEPLGYVTIIECEPLISRVAPSDEQGVAADVPLVDGARCTVHWLNYQLQPLRVALMGSDAANWYPSIRESLADRRAPVQLVDSNDADWVLWLDELDSELRGPPSGDIHEASAEAETRPGAGRALLIPAAGIALPADLASEEHAAAAIDLSSEMIDALIGRGEPLFALPADDTLPQELAEVATRIYRAQALLDVSRKSRPLTGADAERFNLQVRMLKYRDRGDTDPEPLDSLANVAFQVGDIIAVEVENRGSLPADVNILFVDSRQGIQAIFPSNPYQTLDNRVEPGDTYRSPRLQVDDSTVGLEHLVVIGVANRDRSNVNLAGLAQPSLAQAREAARSQDRELTPLEQLLHETIYLDSATTRSTRVPSDLGRYDITLFSFYVLPQTGAAEQ